MECAWWAEVSAMLDGEESPGQRPLVEAHARRCRACNARVDALALLDDPPTPADADQADTVGAVLDHCTPAERRWLAGHWNRFLLSMLGFGITGWAAVEFLTSSAQGASGHTARHLATWQLGFGVALLLVAIRGRLSHAMLALATTVAVFTAAATVWDIAVGHQGAWGEWIHLVEIAGVVLLWLATPPHLQLWSRPAQADVPSPAPRLELVPGEDPGTDPT